MSRIIFNLTTDKQQLKDWIKETNFDWVHLIYCEGKKYYILRGRFVPLKAKNVDDWIDNYFPENFEIVDAKEYTKIINYDEYKPI